MNNMLDKTVKVVGWTTIVVAGAVALAAAASKGGLAD